MPAKLSQLLPFQDTLSPALMLCDASAAVMLYVSPTCTPLTGRSAYVSTLPRYRNTVVISDFLAYVASALPAVTYPASFWKADNLVGIVGIVTDTAADPSYVPVAAPVNVMAAGFFSAAGVPLKSLYLPDFATAARSAVLAYGVKSVPLALSVPSVVIARPAPTFTPPQHCCRGLR